MIFGLSNLLVLEIWYTYFQNQTHVSMAAMTYQVSQKDGSIRSL